MSTTFEPQITAFTCRYCGGVPADMAGSRHLAYPPNIKIIALPCTGKVDAQYLLSAFEQGADGVCIFACDPDNCHHISGSKRAAKRVAFVQSLLQQIGFEPERLEIFHMGLGQAEEFVRIIENMTARIRELGPNPLR